MIFIIVIAILSLDQLTKFLITKNLILHQSTPVINGIFHITVVHNRGAAFGLLKNQLYLFIFNSYYSGLEEVPWTKVKYLHFIFVFYPCRSAGELY